MIDATIDRLQDRILTLSIGLANEAAQGDKDRREMNREIEQLRDRVATLEHDNLELRYQLEHGGPE